MPVAMNLLQLEVADLVRRLPDEPELAYLFKHALVQDAAYASLLKTDRKQLHLAVGETLERLYAGQHEEIAAVLADHFAQGGDTRRARGYYTQAGDAALGRYAVREAADLYAHALELDDDGGDRAWRLHVYTTRGRALELAGDYHAALEHYRAMEQTAQAGGDNALLLAALLARATIRSTTTPVMDTARAVELLDQALVIARRMGDRPAEARILWNLMLACKFSGRASQGLVYGEQSLAIARELGLREQLAFTLNDLGMHAHLDLGQLRRALERTEEATPLWRELGNQPMLADNLCGIALIAYTAGDLPRVLAAAEEALRVSSATGNLWCQAYARWPLGGAYYEQGRLALAIEVLEESVRLAEQGGNTSSMVGAGTLLTLAYSAVGAAPQALAAGRRALAHADQHLADWRTWPLGALVNAHLLAGDVEAAAAARATSRLGRPGGYRQHMFLVVATLGLADVELALAQGQAQRAVEDARDLLAWLPLDKPNGLGTAMQQMLGRAWLAAGRVDEAEAALGTARAEAEALGARRMLWELLAAQAACAARRGDAPGAAALRTQARAEVEAIAAQCGPWRATFLARPDVRGVLGD
jgi:tetratricopeptide (TPR) repeat protein